MTPRAIALVVLALARAALADPDDEWGGLADAGVADVRPPALLERVALTTPDSGVSGDVDVLLTIDSGGTVVDVQLKRSPDEALTAEALSAAKKLRFRPATRDGLPLAVVIDFRFHFAPAPPPNVDAGVPMARITGQLTTKGTREPVPSALVALMGTAVSTFSDDDGRFALDVPAGSAKLEVKSAGHKTKVFPEVVAAGVTLDVRYRLEREFNRPYETIVRGQTDRAEVSRVRLSGAELTEVAGTGGEPLRVIMVLPGVTTPASGLSYPVVRGALPGATGFFLDGVRIPQLYHLLLGPSVVHPDFIEAIDFFPANAPARYGRVTGGVVSAQVAKPRTDRVHATGYADLTNAGAYAEVPVKQTGTSITLAGRVSYAGWLLSALAGVLSQQTKPVVDFYDYQARVEQRLGAGSLRLLAFGSSDLVGARDTDPNRPSAFVTSRFHRIDLRAQYPLGAGQLEAAGNVGWETLGLFSEQNGSRTGAFLMERFVLNARTQYRLELGTAWQVKVGADVERQQADVETTTEIAMGASVFRPPRAIGFFGGPFAELAFFRGPWSVVAGVRADGWHLVPDVTLWSVEPRVDARYVASDKVTVRATAGLAHQSPLLLISLPVVDVAALRDGLHQVAQFSAGVTVALPMNLQLSVDGYLNPILQARERSLRQFVSGISSLDDRFTGGRTGRAYGLEVMLRAPQQGRFFGWLAYSLMRSERLRRFALYSADQDVVGDTQSMVAFAFDQTHVLNLVAGYQLPKGWKVSATFHLNTGRPESGEFSSRTQREATNQAGQSVWSIVPLNQVDRLPPFVRLDARASKTFFFTERSLELYLDVLNVLLTQEVYAFSYSGGGEVPLKKESFGAPLFLPTLGLKGTF